MILFSFEQKKCTSMLSRYKPMSPPAVHRIKHISYNTAALIQPYITLGCKTPLKCAKFS